MKQLKWTTIKQYVDIDTGELLREHDALNKYYIINKKTHSDVNAETQRGKRIIVIACKRSSIRS